MDTKKRTSNLGSHRYAEKGVLQGDQRKQGIEEDKTGVSLLGRCYILVKTEVPIPILKEFDGVPIHKDMTSAVHLCQRPQGRHVCYMLISLLHLSYDCTCPSFLLEAASPDLHFN